jgi:hypothetical protein
MRTATAAAGMCASWTKACRGKGHPVAGSGERVVWPLGAERRRCGALTALRRRSDAVRLPDAPVGTSRKGGVDASCLLLPPALPKALRSLEPGSAPRPAAALPVFSGCFACPLVLGFLVFSFASLLPRKRALAIP